MHKFLVMVNSFSIRIFTCVAFAALHSCFCWGNTGSRDSSWKNGNWCVCVYQELAKIQSRSSVLHENVLWDMEICKMRSSISNGVSALAEGGIQSGVSGRLQGNSLEYWLFDAELQPKNVETASMQSSVFKAEVKAKVIALPA